ncbi:hypothetical protein D3C72_926920 [compost metagenome]
MIQASGHLAGTLGEALDQRVAACSQRGLDAAGKAAVARRGRAVRPALAHELEGAGREGEAIGILARVQELADPDPVGGVALDVLQQRGLGHPVEQGQQGLAQRAWQAGDPEAVDGLDLHLVRRDLGFPLLALQRGLRAGVGRDEAQHVGGGAQVGPGGLQGQVAAGLDHGGQHGRHRLAHGNRMGQPAQDPIAEVRDERFQVVDVGRGEGLLAIDERPQIGLALSGEVVAHVQQLEADALVGERLAIDAGRLEKRRGAIDVVLADRAGAVGGAVEAVVADDVHARQHVRGADAPAEQAWLILGLQEVAHDLAHPQSVGIGGDVVGEAAEERLVPAVGTEGGGERLACPQLNLGQFGSRERRQAIA